jgi:hypothetical protein
VKGSRIFTATYLTPRGHVCVEDLTVDDVIAVADVFELRHARLLAWDAFAALCGALGLEVLRYGDRVIGRVRRGAA